RGRRRTGLRRNQSHEVRGELIFSDFCSPGRQLAARSLNSMAVEAALLGQTQRRRAPCTFFFANSQLMARIHPLSLEHERNRFMRPDAQRFLRPDWQRFFSASHKDDPLYRLYEHIERKYSPDQPRVPRGNPGGGQWTGDSNGNGRTDPRVVSDTGPESFNPGAQYAQNRSRGGFSRVIINGQQVEPTPGQQARLAVVEAQAQDAIRRVQELDPKWRPEPSVYESVEGLIGAYQADARQAQDRISELQSIGIGPGPFAGESIPARGPRRDFTVKERGQLNDIGRDTGCHTCGTETTGTRTGNFVADHQPPSALNFNNGPQRLFPQCLTCSLRQGGWITGRGTYR
ncbi:MAG TPA: hypothetical protein VLK33_23170, partial [Terriglobales bacterium]|nr:hypothetical protein [Terriglobales bacterium]